MRHGKKPPPRAGAAPRQSFAGGKAKRFGGKKPPALRGRGNDGDAAPRRSGDDAGGSEKPFRGGGRRDRFDMKPGARPDRESGSPGRSAFNQHRRGADESVRKYGDRPVRRSRDPASALARPEDRDPGARSENGRRLDARKSSGARDDERDAGSRSDYGRQERPRDKHAKHRRRPGDHARPEPSGALWIYGKHAALAAIRNESRKIKRILVSDSALDWLNEAGLSPERRALVVKAGPFEIDRALHEGAVHQGLAVDVESLPRARLRETCAPDDAKRPVVVLDQITDPHNIGAVLRSAAAFRACAIIVQDRRTPPLAGALAKAAAGAVEIVPCIEVVNIARALEGLKDLGYFCVGLAGDATKSIGEIPRDKPVALVLGAEGAGLRRLVGETCDEIFRIPLDASMDSLNVSNAAAVALYEIGRSAP